VNGEAREASRPSVAAGRPGLILLVDARGLFVSGIGRYLREVVRGAAEDRRFGRLILLGDPRQIAAFAADSRISNDRLLAHPFPGGFYSPRSQLAWLDVRRRRELRADVAFFPHYDAPVLGIHPRSVVAVQDLTHFRLPHLFPAWRRAVAGHVLNRVVHAAVRVLVSSSSARADLVERIPAAAAKVETVPLGVSEFFLTNGASASNPAVEALRPFLLCVGNRKPHKNLTAAVEVLARLRRRRPELKLVVAGRAFEGWNAVLERADELGVRDAVVEIDTPDDERLRALYSACEVLLFPSLYEGFGLPVLEAMACGAPVVASDRASLPEVVGDAGLLVDPADPDAWEAAVERLLTDAALRQRLVSAGHRRASQFTWERTGKQTAEILVQAAAGGGVHHGRA
jgi:glycosyltransferase involved in cell wall biosynthesis